jgi:hypothetical protein
MRPAREGGAENGGRNRRMRAARMLSIILPLDCCLQYGHGFSREYQIALCGARPLRDTPDASSRQTAFDFAT